MKKALFLTLAVAVGMTAFAQREIVKAPELLQGKAEAHRLMMGKDGSTEAMDFVKAPAMTATTHRFANLDETDVMVTCYDLQTNGYVHNRMVRFDDGSVGVTATMSHAGTSAAPDRGTGYNYYDGSSWGDQPDERIEDVKTGWPSYAKYGPNGEIVCAHTSTDLVYTTRSDKGTGDWAPIRHIPNPDMGLPAQEMCWARITTSGPNNDIIHIICADQWSDSTQYTWLYYCRSVDGENWDIQLCPELEGVEVTGYSADDYAIASYGNTVAILLTGALDLNTYVIKSNDNGLTWEKILVWENPYDGLNWEYDEASVFTDTLYAPYQGTIAVDKNGLVHCAFNSVEFSHTELGTSYTYWYGMAVDGIRYWNENMGPIVDRVHDEYPVGDHYHDANQHHAMKFWWPVPDDPGYIQRDLDDPWVGFIPAALTSDWSNDQFYYVDYKSYNMGSCSVNPAICIDEDGIIAVAYQCPDPGREPSGEGYYYRSVYVSYVEGEGDYYYYEDDITNADFIHMMDECINVSAAPNTSNNEFWFCYTSDYEQGFGIGSNATQPGGIQDNTVWAFKVVPNYEGMNVEEAVNPMTTVNVYPNPASSVLNINVNASQASVMDITVYNITGQKVMATSANLSTGLNNSSINVANLTSGIYFVTVSANGFEETLKFVVK